MGGARTINPERRLTLKVDRLPPARGDRALIKQVVTNLLSNAIKFTGTRDNAIIEAGGQAKGDENVYTIKDNGVGFDMQFSDKLFTVFQRLHSRTTLKARGWASPSSSGSSCGTAGGSGRKAKWIKGRLLLLAPSALNGRHLQAKLSSQGFLRTTLKIGIREPVSGER